MSRSDPELLGILLDYIRRQRGVDFSAYKPPSLKRRLQHRIEALGLSSYGDYLDHLQASPDELNALLDTLFINVTGFFRDPDAWQALREQVIPALLTQRPADASLRIWCASVASGEEAYTLAMLLAEALPADEFRDRVKIFATDIDEDALATARLGAYTARRLDGVPDELRDRYFEASGERFVFRADLRRCIIFGRHNLLEDAPISRLDLLTCRNTLMYFNRDAQSRILSRFHFALRDDGYLFLGNAELLLTRRQMFQPVEAHARIFRKVTHLSLHDRLSLLEDPAVAGDGAALLHDVQLRDIAFEASPTAQLLIDTDGRLAGVNQAARAELALHTRDVGRAISELEISYRPVELRSLIEQALAELRPVRVDGIERPRADGRSTCYDLLISPLHGRDGGAVGVSVAFLDVTRPHELRRELEQSRHELETAYEELQSTNEELETTIEELETTNEELQSTNEELETMNEELYSTNDEIRAINDQVAERNEQVSRLNGCLRAILDCVAAGVIVLDDDLNVSMWNSQASELWGLREDETRRRSFLSLDIGLPVDELRTVLRQCLRGEWSGDGIVVPAHNRRGTAFDCVISCTPLAGPGAAPGGVIIMMEPVSEPSS